jgi:hypothetical protein
MTSAPLQSGRADGFNMKLKPRRRSPWTLWWLIAAAFGLGSLYYFFPTLTGVNEIDGLIAVWAGLYICSHPAANFLDILLFRGHIHWWEALQRSPAYWLALNVFTLLIGFLLILIGMIRFFSGWK